MNPYTLYFIGAFLFLLGFMVGCVYCVAFADQVTKELLKLKDKQNAKEIQQSGSKV